MKSILICSLALLLPAITVQAWDILWIYQFGSGIVTGSIAGGKTDATGVYTAGSTFPALPGQKLVGGSTDAYVRKFSFAGTVLWTREFGTQGFDIETALTMDPAVFMLRAGPPEHFLATALPGVTMPSYESMIQLETCCGPLSWKHWGSTSSFRTQ